MLSQMQGAEVPEDCQFAGLAAYRLMNSFRVLKLAEIPSPALSQASRFDEELQFEVGKPLLDADWVHVV